jgi:error-prone DNA polymerase
MGFYAPAQIVRDAREHGVEIRPVDVNFSNWDNRLEKTKGAFYAVRLGLRQVDGLSKEVMEAFVAMRDDARCVENEHQTEQVQSCPEKGQSKAPVFVSIEQIRRRSGLAIAVLERLAAADCFRSLGLDRRQALWKVRGLASDARLPLFEHGKVDALGTDPKVDLPEMPLSEHVVADYQTHRLSLKAHPVSFLRKEYGARQIISSRDLLKSRNGQHIQIAGVVLVRQKPGTAKGVVFMTLEDESGVANIIVWSKIMRQYRKVVMRSRLVLVRGKVQRQGAIIHVIADSLVDLSDDLSRLSNDSLPPVLARADEVKNQVVERPFLGRTPRAGHPRNVRIIPKSRDFH